jgi:hypothetical protein
MSDPVLRFVYITLPTASEPTLNINVNNTHFRFRLTRDQLYDLNHQTADALSKGRIRTEDERAKDLAQLHLPLND